VLFCPHISNKNESQKGAAKMPSCLKGHSQQITNAIKQEKNILEHAQKGTEMLKKKGAGGRH
jgi:hypothetical protein